MQQRVEYFDFLRGVAILMVVAIHCFGVSLSYEDLSEAEILIRNLMNVAVPIFLAVSGFFCAKKKFCCKTDYYSFLKKQILRVYLPVLFCSLPLLIVALKIKGIAFSSFLIYFSCGFSVYYFIALIIQLYFLLPFIEKVYNRSLRLFKVLCAFSVFLNVACWSIYLYVVSPVKSLPLLVYAGGFWMWCSFFLLGFLWGKEKERKQPVVIWGIVTFIGLILCYLESLNLNLPGALNGFGQKGSAIFFSCCLLFVLFSSKAELFFEKNKIVSFVAVLGRYSFGIYLIHCYLIGFIGKRIGLNGDLKWFCLTIIVILASFFVLFIVKKLFPKATRILLGV